MKKKKAVRIALFILAVVVAVGAFTAGVLSLAHRENGYYDVGFTDAGNAILYPSGLHLYYYAEGSSNEIRRLINEVQKVYTSLALDTYKLLDASVTYEGTNNIASVNAAPNRWVSVSPALYGILESAYSHRTESYSPFAGALHKQWEVLRYLEEPESFDPLNDSDKRALLKKYAEWTAAPGAFDLLFDKTEGKVQLAVSDEYLAWAQENDIDAPVLDLNVL